MNHPGSTPFPPPQMPLPLALPIGLVPSRLHGVVLAGILNRLFTPELRAGELDFMSGRVVRIRVRDARLTFRLTLAGGRLAPATAGQGEDLSIEGTVYDFLLLATRREDPDTLFFNRRLRLGGDTELGLYVKNFLDALELEDRLGMLLGLLDRATSVIARMP